MSSYYEHQGQSNPFDSPLDSFRLVAETRRQVEAISEQALEMIKQHFKSPEQLRQTIEERGTPVYLLQSAFISKLALFFLGFEPGFIPPSHTRRYQWLCKLLNHTDEKPHCTSEKGVFVLVKPLFTVGFMAHQLHHWMACASGLPGYSEGSQSLYRKFWEKDRGVMTPQKAERMTADDIIQLRQAIHRDLDAMKFMYQLIQEIFVPANRAQDLSNGATTA